MVINSKEELDILLNGCKAIPYSEIREGGNFYKVKARDFLFPDGSVQPREYIDKRAAGVAVPMTDDGNFVFVVQPISLVKEGALIELPAGYFEIGEVEGEAAIRELAEETGYVPNEVVSLGSHYQDPGSIPQEVSVYLMLGCKNLGLKKLDRGEYCKEVEIPYDLTMELLDSEYIKDANTQIALSKADRYLRKNYVRENGPVFIKK